MKSLVFLLFVMAISSCGAAPPAYNITPTNPDDTITYNWANGLATFDITSPRGIGGADIVRTSGNMPDRIFLRLRLKGLESLKLQFENTEVNAAISSSGAATAHVRARVNGGAEMEITSESEYWMPIEIVSVSDKIPLVDRYIQVELPRALYESDARQFSIEWVDFFR